MAEFGGSFAGFKPNTLTFSETAYNMELAHHFPDLLHTNAADLNPLVPNSTALPPNISQFPLFNLGENGSDQNNMFPSDHSSFAPQYGHLPLPSSRVVDDQKGVRKRKVVSVSDASSGVSSIAPLFGNGLDVTEKKILDTTNDMSGGGKRIRRCNKKQVGKVEEVIHVRAKRGQATDSHSLAERVRREKINERMRCLQELVPGCYKTMGMAVMLDEIINYVQSLQNQVEFLSMKLSAAANSFSNLNLDTDILRTQQGTDPYEAQDMEWLVREAYGGAATFHSTLPL